MESSRNFFRFPGVNHQPRQGQTGNTAPIPPQQHTRFTASESPPRLTKELRVTTVPFFRELAEEIAMQPEGSELEKLKRQLGIRDRSYSRIFPWIRCPNLPPLPPLNIPTDSGLFPALDTNRNSSTSAPCCFPPIDNGLLTPLDNAGTSSTSNNAFCPPTDNAGKILTSDNNFRPPIDKAGTSSTSNNCPYPDKAGTSSTSVNRYFPTLDKARTSSKSDKCSYPPLVNALTSSKSDSGYIHPVGNGQTNPTPVNFFPPLGNALTSSTFNFHVYALVPDMPNSGVFLIESRDPSIPFTTDDFTIKVTSPKGKALSYLYTTRGKYRFESEHLGIHRIGVTFADLPMQHVEGSPFVIEIKEKVPEVTYASVGSGDDKYPDYGQPDYNQQYLNYGILGPTYYPHYHYH